MKKGSSVRFQQPAEPWRKDEKHKRPKELLFSSFDSIRLILFLHHKELDLLLLLILFMKFLQVSSLLLALSGAYAGGDSSSVQCGKKQGAECEQRVKVNASTAISGLIDDVPKEVYEAFVIASTECLQCVDESNVQVLHSRHNGCNSNKCKGCGEKSETWWTCRSCCDECRCMGCDNNLGPGGGRKCDDCCDDRRKLSVTTTDDVKEEDVNFNINVCMDNVNPLDSSSTSYVDHVQMLADFEAELEACYTDTEGFMDSWSSLCADSGIDLSLMARQEGEPKTILFGANGLDSEHAVVTTYSSDESHQSTSHMIFYSALGFVAVSAFAVVGTAVVVKALNKRRAAKDAQEAQWVSEMSSVDNTANPLSGSGTSDASP